MEPFWLQVVARKSSPITATKARPEQRRKSSTSADANNGLTAAKESVQTPVKTTPTASKQDQQVGPPVRMRSLTSRCPARRCPIGYLREL